MYQRVILKLSGEAMKGKTAYGIDPETVKGIALEIKEIYALGVQVGVVIGAGNLWRGVTGEQLGMDRAQADYMGMLGTIMNGLALQDALEGLDVPSRVMSALTTSEIAEPYIRRRAIRHLEKGRVAIFVGGTGSPYFSTDTAAGLRAAEIGAEIVLMAKNGVEGVYDKDPKQFEDAKLYKKLTLEDVIKKELKVMDSTAASICRDNRINIVVFDMNKKGNMRKAVSKEDIGTYVQWED